MLWDGLTRQQVEDLAISTLVNQTIARQNVFSPRTWPTTPDKFPVLLVQIPQERKVSEGRALTKFITTMTLVVVGRVRAFDQTTAEDDMSALAGQVEDVLLSTTSFVQNFQGFPTVETQMVVTSDSRYHVGEFGIKMDLELTQAWGPTGTPLQSVSATIVNAADSNDFTVNTSAAQTAAGTTLQFAVNSLSGLWVGASVAGANIPPNATVSSFSVGAGTVTLSVATTAVVPTNTPVTFEQVFATATQTT
jgi:hypothetical protein